MPLNESTVEAAALEWFESLGYAVGHGPHLAPGDPPRLRRIRGACNFQVAVSTGNARRDARARAPDRGLHVRHRPNGSSPWHHPGVGRLEAVKKDDVVPELVSKVDPRYPPEPLQGIPRGTVTAEFWVSPEGNVSGVKILKSSHPTLRKPVLDALPQWHFAPPMRNGRPERMRLRTEIEFTLEGRPGSLDPPKKSTGAESGSSPDAR